MKKNIIVLFFTVLIAVFFGACSSENSEQKQAHTEKALRIALSSDPGLDNLDNIVMSTNLIQANALVYEGLVKYGKKGEMLPSLAESWDISEDGKKYTFYLRKGVTFSDGTPLNAEAVKFSFDRWVYDPKSSSVNIARYLDTIEIADEMTIVFTFKEKYYPILTEFSYPRPVRIMGINSVDPAGDPKGAFVKPIGTGAWVVDSYQKDQTAVLTANPNYWGEVPSVKKIEFFVIPDAQARIYAMQNNEIDITGGPMSSVAIDSLPSLKDAENIDIKYYPSTTSFFGIFNYNNPALRSIAVRKAMNMLIDKKAIVEHLMNGIGKPAKALFQEDVPYTNDENSEWYPFTVEKAKKLLADDGFQINSEGVQEKNGEQLRFTLVFSNQEYPEWKAIAEYMQSQYAKAGIKLTLDNREMNAYYDSLWKDRDYDLIIYRTYSDSWNPHGFLLSLFTGSESSPAVAWQDTSLSAMIENVLIQTTEEEKQKGYNKIYKKMYEDVAYIPLYYPEEIFLVNKRLKNVEAGFDSFTPFLWNKIEIQ